MSGGYAAPDGQRRVPEPDKDSARSEFARDRARVLHCSALRRLAGKTQVLVAGESDIPRTRLTHSLEVAQVARELGGALGCDPDVVDVAGLAHDLGHPPFGHNGEAVLDELGSACGGFEGNAQTFRVLTRLEAKVFADGTSAGLNLTRASLDAATKYPWPKVGGRAKYGVYNDDLPTFEWMRSASSGERRCLEAQVMDWSDDVAYSVHDVDDAIHMGHLNPAALSSAVERARVIEQCRDWYTPDADPAELDEALLRLQALDCWVQRFDGRMAAMAAVKQMTSALIGRFCLAAEQRTRAHYGDAPLRRYDADLLVPRETRLEVAVMKAVAATYVMHRPGAESEYARQREMLTKVVQELIAGDSASLQTWLRAGWESARDDAQRLRVVLDQVASLTDASLERWFHRDS
ncbi:MAG: Deoxyguanosinetriphosphate triphosphohydrolase [Actinomycetota bacterium]